jgi:hypothetical protein
MKKRISFLLGAAAIMAAMLISCSKSYNAPANTSNPVDTTLKTKIISGTWMVRSYTQRTEDKTSQFAGVVFTFSNNGTLTADKNGNITNGTWSYTPSAVGYYGGPPSKASMTLNLGASSPFDRLTKTWNVASNTDTLLKMDNPEPLEDEHLQFSKQ